MKGYGKFNGKSAITKTVRDTAKVTIRKCRTPCQIRWKSLSLDALEGRYALYGAR